MSKRTLVPHPGVVGIVVLGLVAVALAMGAAGAVSPETGASPAVELSGADSVSPDTCHLRGHTDPADADRVLIDVAGSETATMTVDGPTTWGFDVPANSTVTAVAVNLDGEADVLAERQLTAGCTLMEGS